VKSCTISDNAIFGSSDRTFRSIWLVVEGVNQIWSEFELCGLQAKTENWFFRTKQEKFILYKREKKMILYQK
jgi:hypothetical protein